MAGCIYSGASIGDFHTWKDWRAIIQNSDVVGSPEPNTNYLEVPGGNGHIDLTETLTGDVTYSTRTLKFELALKTNPAVWPDTISRIFNSLHGKAVQVILDEEPTHYFYGRVNIDGVSRAQISGQLTVTVECDPYRYELGETTEFFSVSDTEDVSIENDRMWVSPAIWASRECTLTLNGMTYSIAQGNQQRMDIVLKDGVNQLTITGNVMIGFTFRKGCL